MSCGSGEYVRLMENYPLVTGEHSLQTSVSFNHSHLMLLPAAGGSGACQRYGCCRRCYEVRAPALYCA